jgi:carbamoyltransferase
LSYLLGINCSGFLSSACLLSERGVHTAICEERISRIKQDRAFPRHAIRYCLAAAGIELTELAGVHIGWHPRFYLQQSDHSLREAFRDRGKMSYLALNELASLADGELRDVSERLALAEGDIDIHFLDHHRAHLANAFYQSGFEQADFLMLDGWGEVSTGLSGTLDRERVTVFDRIDTPHSLGSFYSTFTDFLGFRPNVDEWKVMALAAFGDATRYYADVRRMIRVSGLRLELDLSYFEHYLFITPRSFSRKFVETFGEPLAPGEEPSERHCDLVAALQRVAEEVVFELLEAIAERGEGRRLVVGGGFFMNSVCNGKLLDGSPYEEVFVGGSPDDSGVSVGSAFHGAASRGWRLPLEAARHNYFGRPYEREDVRRELERRKLRYRVLADPAAKAADLLQERKIVGWFRGRSEFGQRALGNRSILANPTDPEAKETVNATVKYREHFRPFAPAVLQARQRELFAGVGSQTSYFMEKVFPFAPAWAKRVPAVVHADGSGRLQTVSDQVNPRFHQLIGEFEKRSGVPVVLNTSFNTNGMPLVETPGDAIGCFFDSGLDALILEDLLVEK